VSSGTRWSDPTTWGGTLPPVGATVVIPAGKTVVLDTATPALGGLTIEGELVAAPDADVGITSDYVYVKGGRLQIGSASQPYLRNATITLTGSGVADSPATPGFGSKALAMMGGIVELHGAPRARNWTRLDGGDVAAGSRTIRVADATGWKAGDEIVIATSSLDQNAYSLSTIESVSGNVITLREPTRYRHFGARRQVGDVTVDVRAEVGLLSQNIVIRSDAAAGSSNVGGHTMLMAGTGTTTVQIANVQFHRLGQLNQLGRYPLHFHLMGDNCIGCYVRDTTIRDSIQRGLVLHDTNNILVAGNVVFNTVGHNIVIETGVTRANTLDGNLALVNREPVPKHTERTLVDQNDRMPSNFWLRGAENAIINNAAAGSQANGYIYDAPGAGNFDFRNNVAHAAMGMESAQAPGDFDIMAGLMIIAERPAGHQDKILDTLVYHSAHGIWPEESPLVPYVIDRFIVAENGIGVQNRGVGSKQIYRNGVFIGTLPNSGVMARAGVAMHNQYGSDNVIENPVFANYPSGVALDGTDTGPTQSSYRIVNARFVGANTGLQFTDLSRYTLVDDSVMPRGYYVDAAAPWTAPPGCTPTALGEMRLLRCPPSEPGIGELEVRLSPTATFDQKIAAMVTRNDGLRYAISSERLGSGMHSTTVLHNAPGVSFALEQSSTYYAMRLWDIGGDPLLMNGQGSTLVSVSMTTAPRLVGRGPTTQSGNPGGDPGEGRDAVPSAGLTNLRAVPSVADLMTSRDVYFYDGAARRLWVNVTPAWLVVQQ
jgi:hypothetical protein